MGVTVDMSGADRMMSDLEAALKDKKAKAMIYGARLVRQDQMQAMSRKASPDGVPWAVRTRSYPWPLMYKTGELMRSVTSGWGLKTKSGKPKLFAKLNSDEAKLHIRAGALHFGRTGPGQSRHAAYRARRRRRAGTAGPGIMPPRPFFGISKSSRRKFTAYWKQQIRAATD